MSGGDAWARLEKLEAGWSRLATRYVPLATADSSWRYSLAGAEELPRQGWKLHLSATILTATTMLRRVGPELLARGVPFKAVATIGFLEHLNSGLDGFSQVGKALTVYCRNDAEAVQLAHRLDELTAGLAHPEVPFDAQYRRGSCVYYRYAAFSPEDGDLVDPAGGRHPDERAPGAAVPTWIADPIRQAVGEAGPAVTSPLAVDYRAFSVVRERGKGGVYTALDLTQAPARLCILKEGRANGETNVYGEDGRQRVRNEARVLRSLGRAGLRVPRVFTEFEVDGNWYLVEEHVEGPTLAEILHTRRMSSPAQRLRIAAEFVGLVAGIHDAGWAWRDCKPENVIVDATGALVAIDFEGARRLTARPAAPWGTPPYLAPSPAGFGEVDDLYSVGVALSEVLTGRGFNSPAFTAVRGAAAGLRSDRPAERPSLVTVRSLLESTVREAANARADLTPVATGIILR